MVLLNRQRTAMADNDSERSESPSQQRLAKVRAEAQVVRSRERSAFLLLLAAAGAFSLLGAQLVEQMGGSLRQWLTQKDTVMPTKDMNYATAR